MDDAYFAEQKAFLASLTPDEELTLLTYTQYGFWFVTRFDGWNPTPDMLDKGMNIIRTMIRNESRGEVVPNMFWWHEDGDLKKIKREDLAVLSQQYATDLWKIFQKAPALKKEATVYRGIREAYDPSKTGLILSTTYATDWDDFSSFFVGDECCFMTLHLAPGVKTIWVSGVAVTQTQKEIILVPYMNEINCVEEPEKKVLGKKSVTAYTCAVTPKPVGGRRKTRRRRVKMSRKRVNGR